MADLTDLLGTAYSRQPAGRSVPEWSDDDHLERAFASWSPGPGPEASATEREMFVSATRSVQPDDTPPDRASFADLPYADDDSRTAATAPPPALDESAQLDPPPHAPVWSEEVAAPAEADPPPPAIEERPHTSWRREDEDVLPGRMRVSLRLPSFRR
jgi:hypothetical protein